MKENIYRFLMFVVKAVLYVPYFFLKLFPTKNKITMLSRQSNKKTLDFRLIENELFARDDGFTVVIICKRIENGFLKKVDYFINLFKSLYHIATSKVCIVDTYCIPVSLLKHKKDLIIIQIWHALGAVKKFGYQSLDKQDGRSSFVAKSMNMHKNYNYVFCASEATKHFYSEAFNIAEDKIIVNGMPRIDYILGDDSVLNTRIASLLRNYPVLGKKKNILYIPTYRKDFRFDFQAMSDLIDEKKYNLIVKLHPLDNSDVSSNRALFFRSRTFELLHIADYVVTDYSAIAFEASLLDKPVYFYVFDIKDYERKRGLNIDLFKEMSNATFESFADIMARIDKENYNFEELRAFRGKYVQTSDTLNTKRVVDSIYEALGMKTVEKVDSDNQKVNI